MNINQSTFRPNKWSIPAGIVAVLTIAYLWGYLRNSYCQSCGIQNTSTIIQPANISVSETDASSIASLVPFSNFVFFKSSNKLEQPAIDEEMQGLLSVLKKEENKDKRLLLTGKYQKDEGNNTLFDNIGVGRAEAVKAFLVANGIPASQILTKGVETKEIWRDDYKDRIVPELPSGNPMTYSFVTSMPLSIVDGTTLNIQEAENFAFPAQKEHFKSLNPTVDAALRKTAEYLKTNTNRQLKITGHYDESEKDIVIEGFENLGLARAEDVKNKLLEYGGKSLNLRISTASQMSPLFFEEGVLDGGISFDFNSFGEDVAESTDDVSTGANEGATSTKDYESLLAKPLNLYFNTSKQTVNISAVEREYLSDLIAYVGTNSSKRILVEGHTDNTGKEHQNMRLSRKRAEYVRTYLIENGVDGKRIKISFKGQEQPIVDNDTPENRAKNRRVEVGLNK